MALKTSKLKQSRVETALRLSAILGTEAACGLVLGWASAPVLHPAQLAAAGGPGASGRWTFDLMVVAAAACVAWVVFCLLVVSTLVTVLLVPVQRILRPMPLVERLAGPIWWRRAVLTACGISLAAPLAAHAVPAADEPGGHCAVCSGGRSAPPALSGLRLPDLPSLPRAHPENPRVRVVRPGDSLWLIERRTSAPSASDSIICREVRALYSANRQVIGPDPDLILPGTELTQPGGTA